MAQTFSEWHRGNGGGSYADYENYLQKLAALTEQPGDPVSTRTPESALPGGRDTKDTWTREEISALVNQGAALVEDDSQLSLSDRDADLVNLIVNAALSMFDGEPPATLDEVIERNWDPEPECEVCGGGLVPDGSGGWRHGNSTPDDHAPALRSMGSVVRGWVNGG